MSEELSVGIKILLERAKSNPEEVMDDYGKWGQLREAVYAYKEEGHRRPWIRGLRPDEIDLLYEAFSAHARQIFDDYVLSNVLGVDEGKEEKHHATKAMTRAKLMQNTIQPGSIHPLPSNPYQNAIQPGSWQNVTTETSSTSVAAALKNALGFK